MTLNVIKVLSVITFGPKCKKGPKCKEGSNNIICLIGFSPRCNGSLNSIPHVYSIAALNLIKSLTETCDGLVRYEFYSQLAIHFLRPVVVFIDIHKLRKRLERSRSRKNIYKLTTSRSCFLVHPYIVKREFTKVFKIQ